MDDTFLISGSVVTLVRFISTILNMSDSAEYCMLSGHESLAIPFGRCRKTVLND